MTQQTAKYDEIRNELDTGDIVLFSGKGGISTGIKWITSSVWSHVGMVLRIPEYNLALLWESTTLSSIADLETGKARQGVQLVPLSERLKQYDGEVSIRRLDIQRTPDQLAALMDFRSEVKGRPYEQNKVELVKSAYDGAFGQNQEDLSSLFCSELVAEAYQRLGLISDQLQSNEFTPADFSEKSGAIDRFLQASKAKLSSEIIIK